MAYSPNVNVLLKQSQGIDKAPLNSLSVSSKLIKYFNSLRNYNPKPTNPLKSSQYNAILTQNTDLLKLGGYSSPSFIDYDKLLYSWDSPNERLDLLKSFKLLNSKLYLLTQKQSVIVYQILILLSLK